MINISKLITNDIVNKHKDYISNDKKILSKLLCIYKNYSFYFSNQNIFEFNTYFKSNITVQLFRSYLYILIHYISKNIIDLRTSTNIESNIFICNTKELHLNFLMLKLRCKPLLDYLHWELKSEIDKKNRLSSHINIALGYYDFSQNSINLNSYSNILKSLTCKSGTEIKLLKSQINSNRYYEEDYKIILRFLNSRLDTFAISPKLVAYHKNICLTIGCNHGRISDFISSLNNVIQTEKDTLIEIFKNTDIVLKNYKYWGKWSSYNYIMSLGLKVCPYCNRQYITPIYSESGQLRADLDHFYSKSKYPFFSMSLYNLVPCCKFCNSSLKHTKNFEYETHLNPFEEGFENKVHFKYKLRNNISFDKGIDVILERSPNCSDEDFKKSKNNIRDLKLSSLYNYHTDYVMELYTKKKVYSKAMLKEIRDILYIVTNKNYSNEELIDFITSNYISESDFHLKPLSKFSSDIIDQLDFNNKLKNTIKKHAPEPFISRSDFNSLKKHLK